MAAVMLGTDYKTLNDLLKSKNVTKMKIGNNTTAERHDIVQDGKVGEGIIISLYKSRIATLSWTETWVYLLDMTHHTPTTRQRINQFLPAGHEVVNRKGKWYIKTPDGEIPFVYDAVNKFPVYANMNGH